MENDCRNCKHNVIGGQTTMPARSILMNIIYKCNNKESEYYGEQMGVLTNMQIGQTIDSRKGRHCEKHETV